MTNRKCPICASSENTLLFTQKFATGISHKIASCGRCGFVFVKNSPKQTYNARYYEKMSKYEDTRDFQLHKDCVKVIERYAGMNETIADIGCATGHLLYLLKNDGYKKLSGTDPSPRCREVAREKYKVNVSTNDIYKLKNTKSKYDFVILSAVLEHLENAALAVNILTRLVKDGGKIFICVPDADNFYKDFDEPFGEFSPEHINFFGRSSLYFLMHDFSCLHLSSDGKAIYSLWQKDGGVRNSVSEYIRLSMAKMDRINRVIKEAPDRIIVWGAGALTERLFSSTGLAGKTVLLADRNANLAGKKIMGKKIIPPQELKIYDEPILISSFRFRDEIAGEIRKMGLKNKVISF